MDLDNPEAKAYLFELYTMTQGDPEAQVSMYDVGATLGLEKTDAGTMAEDLFIQGFAELKTLSGGIGITRQGLDVLQVEGVPSPDKTVLKLGTGPVLEDQDQKNVEQVLQDIKTGLALLKQPYAQLAEIVMDIKTIEVQMLSPQPKTAIIREVLRSLHQSMAPAGPKDLAAKINSLITT
ncbi:hypothetical protein [Desulfobacula sp.]|uniref:hypothetical protein n=1 Tax=Desulfobacula sp. TaxID=2593537 RepID=UPI00261BBE24|nr:hypothetical protein [Desulfobacula sp.]